MGKVVSSWDELKFQELMDLLESGYWGSYESDQLATMFNRSIPRGDLFVSWAGCAGGRFVAREPGRSAKKAN